MDVEAFGPLPELPCPEGTDAASLLRALKSRGPLVWAEGRRQAPLAVILDNPGARERAGVPWVCPTRHTLRRALLAADMPAGDVYVTFLFRAFPGRGYDRQAAPDVFLPILHQDIRGSACRVVLALGNTVLRALFGPEADVRTWRGKDLTFESRPVVASYHPLAARRRPALFPLLMSDVRRARAFL